MSPESQMSPLASRLWGRLASLQDQLAQKEPQHAEAIRGPEFKKVREQLCLPTNWLADQYAITPEEVSLWESRDEPVPASIGEALMKLALTTQAVVDNETDRLQRTPAGQRAVTLYNTDAVYHRAHPEAAPLPASWQRGVYSRVAESISGISFVTR